MAAQTQEQWEARKQAETANPRPCPTCGGPPHNTYKYARTWSHYCRSCKTPYGMTPLVPKPREGHQCEQSGCERWTRSSRGLCPSHLPKQRPNRTRTRYKGQLNTQAVAALRADTCLWCGATERLQLDHIQELWYAPELMRDPTNLQTLCWTCHKDKTNAVREATWKLARLNPLHFQALMDTETAKARALKAH